MKENFLISYDISAKHADFKKELINLGYSDSWTVDGKAYQMPSTTVWKNDENTAEKHITQLKNIASRLNIKLEKAVAVAFTKWSALPK